MVLPVDGDAADLAEDPVVRQRLRPGRVDRKGRDIAGLRGAWQRRCADQCSSCDTGGNGSGESVTAGVGRARLNIRILASSLDFIGGFSRLGAQSIVGRERSQRRAEGEAVASNKLVIAREGGRSSTPRLLDSIATASGILDLRFRGDDN
jgi:hypothetical protein